MHEDSTTVTITFRNGISTIIDAQDADVMQQYKWRVASTTSRSGKVYRYVITTIKNADGTKCRVPLHRFLMDNPEGMKVDHRNGDTLDNRRSNLRVATHAQNMQNAQRHAHNTSGYKGVHLDTRSKKKPWRVCISVNNETVHLGGFPDPITAARVYDAVAVEFYGEFACVNFPRKGQRAA